MGNQTDILDKIYNAGVRDWEFTLQNDSLGLQLLYHTPDGWVDGGLKFSRHKTYHGVMRTVTAKELMFFKEGKDFLQRAYEAEGVDCACYLIIRKYNYTAMEYEDYHTAKFDFSTYKINEISVEIELVDDDFNEKFITRANTEVDLNTLTTLEGVTVAAFLVNTINIPAVDIQALATFSGSGIESAKQHVLPITLLTSEFSETQDAGSSYDTEASSFFYQATEARTISIDWAFEGRVSATSQQVEISIDITFKKFIALGGSTNYTVLSESDTTCSTLDFDDSGTQAITLAAGDSIILQADVTCPADYDGTNYNDIDSSGNTPITLSVSQDWVNVDARTVSGFPFYEAFLRCSQIIQDQQNPFHSTLFGRTDTPLTTYTSDGEQLGFITRGLKIRESFDGFNATMPVKLKDMFDSLSAILGLSLNIETISSVQKIRVELMEYAYDTIEVLDISDRLREQDIEKSVDPELIFSSIEVGYQKTETPEIIGGLKEFNTSSKYATIIKAVQNELKALSKYRADNQGIRKLLSAADDEDSKGDDAIFMIDAVRDGGNFLARTDENFTTISGGVDVDQSLNIAYSPARALRRLYNHLRGCLRRSLGSYVTWQTSEKNTTLVSQTTDEETAITESADVLVTDFDVPLWIPENYNVEDVPLTTTEIKAVIANPKGLIKLSDTKYGWIKDGEIQNKDGTLNATILRASMEFGAVLETQTSCIGTSDHFRLNKGYFDVTTKFAAAVEVDVYANWKTSKPAQDDFRTERLTISASCWDGLNTYFSVSSVPTHYIDPLNCTITIVI